MKENTFSLMTLKPQRDHVFHCWHWLLVKPIQQRASAVKVRYVRLWKTDRRTRISVTTVHISDEEIRAFKLYTQMSHTQTSHAQRVLKWLLCVSSIYVCIYVCITMQHVVISSFLWWGRRKSSVWLSHKCLSWQGPKLQVLSLSNPLPLIVWLRLDTSELS